MIDGRRILCLAPHPDDEVLGCGGTLALLAARGASVHVVVVFDGALGDPAGLHPGRDLAGLRRVEAERGGAWLGVERYHFWGLPEGHAPSQHDLEAAVHRLDALVRELEPDVLLVPWEGDDHPDHRSVARLAAALLEGPGFTGEVWAFEVWSPLAPEELVDVSGVWETKLRALSEHRTQLAYADLLARATELATRFGGAPREAFRRLGRCA
jgi:LmbE family N-acetylglucosaminyl deacetylase